jgi:hypothetical protein
MEELVAAIESGFLAILRDAPGSMEYFLVQTNEWVLSVSVFADQAGAKESTRRAAEWVQQNLAGFCTGPPTVTTGSVWLHDVGRALSGAPAPQQIPVRAIILPRAKPQKFAI